MLSDATVQNSLSLAPLRQCLSTETVKDVRGAVLSGIAALPPGQLWPGQRVGIGVGSRGIARYSEIVSAVVDGLRAAGAQPFLFPAMGSHGGGTAEGQRDVLLASGMGDLDVPIRSTQDTVDIGATSDGAPVPWDRFAAEADGIVVVNRVKPHTAFRGRWESGLFKMIAVGVGNRRGAETAHARGIEQAIPAAARVAVAAGRVLAGVAIIENGLHQPAVISVVPGKAIEDEEPALLESARRLQPGIPFPSLDLLIVQEMGKDISGTGMDTNVIGMWRRNGGARVPDFRCLAVLDLTPGSHGNATGIGMADVVSRRLVDKVDWEATYVNCLAARNFAGAKQPMVLPTDHHVVTAALAAAPDVAKVVLIRNTLDLDTLWVSPALVGDSTISQTCELVGPLRPVHFDRQGRLIFPGSDEHRSEPAPSLID